MNLLRTSCNFFYRENDESEQQDTVDLSDSLVLLNTALSPPALNSLVYDVLYRPEELEDVPMWDQIGLYEKIRRKKKNELSVNSDDSADEDSVSGDFC